MKFILTILVLVLCSPALATVSTTDNTRSYTGNGVTTGFSFPYIFYDEDHLVVKVNGVTKTIDTDYTVTGEGLDAGGAVTFLSAPANGAAVLLQRIVPYDQQTDLENFDGNPADVTEEQFDLVVMQTQQLAEQQERGIYSPVGTSLTTNEIIGTVTADEKLLAISTAGPAVTSVTTDQIESAADDAAAAAASASAAASAAINASNSASSAAQSAIDAAAATNGVKVSSNDTTPGDLESKVLVGTGLSLSTQNDGANETRTVSLDATLVGLSGLSTGANKIPYSTGSDTFSQFDFSSSAALGTSATTISSQSAVKSYVDTLASTRAYSEYVSNADLTATIPLDDTIPQNTEGTEILTASITPRTATSRIRARFQGFGGFSASGKYLIVALFADAAANALCTSVASQVSNDVPTPIVLECEFVPGDTSAHTYKIRVGPDSAATLRMNGDDDQRYFGGTSRSTLILEEVVP